MDDAQVEVVGVVVGVADTRQSKSTTSGPQLPPIAFPPDISNLVRLVRRGEWVMKSSDWVEIGNSSKTNVLRFRNGLAWSSRNNEMREFGGRL